MIEMGKKYQTRDGRAVRILCVDGPDKSWPVVGFMGDRTMPDVWSEDGRFILYNNYPADLVPVPTKHEGFIVIGKDGFVWGQAVCNTREEAAEGGFKEGDHIVPIHWED